MKIPAQSRKGYAKAQRHKDFFAADSQIRFAGDEESANLRLLIFIVAP